MYQTRSCTDPDCSEERCIVSEACQECDCSEWQDVGCGLGGCLASQMYQTRSCTPTGCDIEERCIESEACQAEEYEEYTLVSIEPKYTFPEDEVTLTIEVYSSNYKSGHDIYFNLTIDGKPWSNEYCKIAFERLNVSKCMEDEHYRKEHKIKHVTSQDGYLKIVATCTIPPDISPGTHVLWVEPQTWSEMIKLPAATTNFVTYRIISLFELLMKAFSSFLT